MMDELEKRLFDKFSKDFDPKDERPSKPAKKVMFTQEEVVGGSSVDDFKERKDFNQDIEEEVQEFGGKGRSKANAVRAAPPALKSKPKAPEPKQEAANNTRNDVDKAGPAASAADQVDLLADIPEIQELAVQEPGLSLPAAVPQQPNNPRASRYQQDSDEEEEEVDSPLHDEDEVQRPDDIVLDMLEEAENLGQPAYQGPPVDPADEVWGDESSTGIPKRVQPERRDVPVESFEDEEPAIIRRERKEDNLRSGMQGGDFKKMMKGPAEPEQEAPEPAPSAPAKIPLFDDRAW